METRHRYSSRMNAIDGLTDLNEDVTEQVKGIDESVLGDYIVQNPGIADHYKATAVTLLIEGRNLLDGKREGMQRLGGGLLRLHFTDEELKRAAKR